MKTVRVKDKHNMRSVVTYEGECIEKKVQRIVNESGPIEDSAPIIFQERGDGVKPEFNIRTNRWEIAIDAMDKVSAEELSKYTKTQVKPGEDINLKKGQEAEINITTEGEATAPADN